LAKLVLDARNMAQKYEALNQKLDLEGNRTDQNLCNILSYFFRL